MTRLDALLDSAETVLERLPVSDRTVVVWIALAVLGAALVLGPALYFADLVLDERLTRLVHTLALFLVVVPGTVLLIPLAGALSERTGLLLTDRRFIWWEGALRRRTHSVGRAEVESVTLYEGHGRLYLDRTDGSRIRVRSAKLEESRAPRLAVPVRIWRNTEPDSSGAWGTFEGVFSATLPVAALWGLMYWFWWDTDIWENVATLLLAALGTIVLVMLILFLLLAVRILLVEPLRHSRARRRLTGAALKRFACRELCRLCRGREPYPPVGGTLWDSIERRADRWLIRKFYGGELDCDCAPELVVPAN